MLRAGWRPIVSTARGSVQVSSASHVRVQALLDGARRMERVWPGKRACGVRVPKKNGGTEIRRCQEDINIPVLEKNHEEWRDKPMP